MTSDSALTILLTLKDRAAFTLRWMSYLDQARFPYKVLIADGGEDERVPRILADKASFPNVDFEYVRYPYDRGYADYYAKIADALSRVRTPFVAMADNDDFFIVSGLEKAVQFLGDHPDHAACGGQWALFWVKPSAKDAAEPVHGRVEWKCRNNFQSNAAATARERMRIQSLNADDVFYHVFRTGILARQFAIVRDLNPRDLFLVEQLTAYLTAIAGKTQHLEHLYLARQQNSPGSSGGTHQQKFGDWFGRMLVPTWSDDFTAFVDVIARALARADGIPIDEARDWAVQCYRMSIAPALLSNILEEPTVTPSMPVVAHAVRRLVRLPETSILKRTARMLYRRVPWISYDSVYGSELVASPVGNAAREFRPIREFLARERGPGLPPLGRS